MIGVFDSGHGGLTILEALQERLPRHDFIYYGDHAHAPYGPRSGAEVLALTRRGVELLFEEGCRLVVLACNTASAAALRTLQQEWLPASSYKGCNVLGIIVPTVEAATKVSWMVKEPVGPRKGSIAVFATQGTCASQVYTVEIHKRCPGMRVTEIACPDLAGAIEANAPEAVLNGQVKTAVDALYTALGGSWPQEAILGCTHYELVRGLFRAALPPEVELLSQPNLVGESLAAYLARHPDYAAAGSGTVRYLTSGNAAEVSRAARRFFSHGSMGLEAAFTHRNAKGDAAEAAAGEKPPTG